PTLSGFYTIIAGNYSLPCKRWMYALGLGLYQVAYLTTNERDTIMKHVKSSLVFFVTIVLVMVSAQSCMEGGTAVHPDEQNGQTPSLETSALLKEGDPASFQKVKDIFGTPAACQIKARAGCIANSFYGTDLGEIG